MAILKPESAEIYKQRRNELIEYIHADFQKDGIVVLFGNFEHDGIAYQQDPSFYYYSGVAEPAATLIIDTKAATTTLYVPNFNGERSKWVAQTIEPSEKSAKVIGVDAVEFSGQSCTGYQCYPYFTQDQYQNVVQRISNALKQGATIFTLNPSGVSGYIQQRFMLGRIQEMVPQVHNSLQDISASVAQMRRKKSKWEIEQLFKAIQITADAHDMVAKVLEPGRFEFEVQAAAEYVFTSSGARIAFPTIVGAGKNGTVLHYNENTGEINKDELVVVDMGAQYNMYCADITRTFPSSGTFTKRQKEIYKLVLETQDYIASLAKPGMWLSHAEKPDQSLNHIAKKFIKDKGYGDYFPHGIGHYLGLDVHDVGSYADCLRVGDVITIEPGIYLPEEGIGVRIEDNYWIVENGAICLSEDIPKSVEDIEMLMQEKLVSDEHEDEMA